MFGRLTCCACACSCTKRVGIARSVVNKPALLLAWQFATTFASCLELSEPPTLEALHEARVVVLVDVTEARLELGDLLLHSLLLRLRLRGIAFGAGIALGKALQRDRCRLLQSERA